MRVAEPQYMVVRNPWNPHGSRELFPATMEMTLADIEVESDCPYIILADGEAILRSDWNTLVADYQHVVVVTLPQGGDGSNPLQAVLMLVVIVASIYTGGAAAALYGGATTTAGAMAGALASSAVMMVGSMVVNAVVPPPTATTAQQAASLASPSPTYSLGAQGNSARIGAAIPVQYGRMKAYPDFAAMPYAEFAGNEQYLYQLFCLGMGQYSIEEIKIDDALISSYAEISYEVIQPHGQCALFPTNVVTASQVAGQTLTVGEFIGPFPATDPGVFCNTIGVDIVMPKGMFYANDEGGLDAVSITVLIEAGPIDMYGVATGPYVVLGSETWTMATNTPQRFSRRYSVASGRYQVRATRLNAENTDARYGHSVMWGSLRAYMPDTTDFGNVTLIAMRMLASNNLSQQSSRKISVLSTRMIPVWNGTTWSANTPSRSIAWALADALRDTEYGAGVADVRLPLEDLRTLENTVWSVRGDHFDARFDNFISMFEALSQIANAGRSKFFTQGGFCRIARDGNATVPVAMFSERNIKKGSFSIDYLLPTDDTADIIEMSYFDDQVWASRTVKSDYAGATGTKVGKKDLFGVTGRAQAYRDAMYLAATNHLRRRVIKFNTEMDGFIPSPLDLIAVQHSMPGWSQQCEAVRYEDQYRRLTVNELLDWGTGQHFVGLRKLDGSMSGPHLVSRGLADNIIIFDNPVDYTPIGSIITETVVEEPAVDMSGVERTHIIFGESPNTIQYAKVINVQPVGMYEVSIEAVAEDSAVHVADAGVVTPPVITSSLVRDYGSPVISELQVVVGGTIVGPEVSLAWRPAAGAEYYVVDQSSDGNTWSRLLSTVTASARAIVSPGLVYLRVAGVRGVDIGPYLEWTGNLVDFMPPPAPPTNLSLEQPFVGRSCMVAWAAAARSDMHRVEVWAEGNKKRTIDVTATRYQYSEEDATADGGPWRTVTFRVYGIGNGVSAEYAELEVSNPQVAVLDGVGFIAGYKQIISTYYLPADTDFAGVIVSMSLTDGFTPSVSDYTYDGPDNLFVLQSDPQAQPFTSGQVWYIRIAGYDKFGKDDLNWSSQHEITIIDADANLTPEQILERLNSSFVQGNVIINGSGAIIAYNGASSIPNRDFVLLDAGKLTYQRYRDGLYREYMGLKRVEQGEAESGETVVIDGWWDSQPKIVVSPNFIKSYETTASGQSQAWAVRADNLQETSPGSKRWQFEAVAELTYFLSSGTTVINQQLSGSSNDQYSSEYNLVSNISALTVNVSALSVRGTATATYGYLYRQVTATVQLWNGVGWVDSGSKVLTIGATTTTAKNDYITCTGVAGKTKMRVRYVSADAGGEFSLGSNQYYQHGPYLTHGGPATVNTAGININAPNHVYGTCYLGAFAVPAYSYVSYAEVSYSGHGHGLTGGGIAYFPNGATSQTITEVYQSNIVYSSGAGYNVTTIPLHVYGCETIIPGYGLIPTASLTIDSATARIWVMTANLSDATPVNTGNLISLNWETAGTSAISTGTLNWIATGE